MVNSHAPVLIDGEGFASQRLKSRASSLKGRGGGVRKKDAVPCRGVCPKHEKERLHHVIEYHPSPECLP